MCMGSAVDTASWHRLLTCIVRPLRPRYYSRAMDMGLAVSTIVTCGARSVGHYGQLSIVCMVLSHEQRAGTGWPTTPENVMAETWDVFISYARADASSACSCVLCVARNTLYDDVGQKATIIPHQQTPTKSDFVGVHLLKTLGRQV